MYQRSECFIEAVIVSGAEKPLKARVVIRAQGDTETYVRGLIASKLPEEQLENIPLSDAQRITAVINRELQLHKLYYRKR